MQNKDYKIHNKYLHKSNLILATNYFNFLIILCASWVAFFFLNTPILVNIIGAIMMLFYVFLYKKKNDSIVTSVTVYKYSDIFLEVLKSFKISKEHITSFKNFISKK